MRATAQVGFLKARQCNGVRQCFFLFNSLFFVPFCSTLHSFSFLQVQGGPLSNAHIQELASSLTQQPQDNFLKFYSATIAAQIQAEQLRQFRSDSTYKLRHDINNHNHNPSLSSSSLATSSTSSRNSPSTSAFSSSVFSYLPFFCNVDTDNNFFSSYVRLSRDLALSCYGHMKLTTTTFPSRPPHLPHRRTFGQQKHPSRNEADKEMPHLFFWILLHNMVLPCTSQRTLGSNSTSLHRCNISISRSE